MQEFDINAPIEQQFTRDGRKVLAIFNSGLSIDYPIALFIEGHNGMCSCSIKGKYYLDESKSDIDIVTRLPDVKSYVTVYFDRGTIEYGCSYASLDLAIDNVGGLDCISIIETSVNPQTLEASAKTVWKKSET